MRRGIVVAALFAALLVAGCSSEVSTHPKNSEGEATTPVTTEEPRGTYSNPASMNEAVVVKTISGTFEISVVDCIRGERANSIVKAANMFNPDPDEGYEYLLVKVKFSYLEGKTSFTVSEYSFKAYSDGTGYSPTFVVLPQNMPEFKTVDLMPGGKVEGWTAFIVPENRETLIAFEYMFEPVGFIKVCK